MNPELWFISSKLNGLGDWIGLPLVMFGKRSKSVPTKLTGIAVGSNLGAGEGTFPGGNGRY